MVIKRREFIRLIGETAAWPFAAYAEQSDRIRKVAVVFGVADEEKTETS